MAINIFDNNKFNKQNMIKCSYSHGGGMLGDVYVVYVERIDDNKASLSIDEAKTHADQIVTTSYTIDASIFDEIRQIMVDHHLYASSKKGKSPFEVLDGPTTSLSFTFEGYDGFRISDYQNLNKNDFEGITKIKNLMLEKAIGEAIVSVQPHELSLQIDGYNIIYIMNHCKVSERLVELHGKYMFSSFKENGKKFKLEEKLDVSDASLALGEEYNIMAYYEPDDEIIFFFDEYDPMDGLYELGKIEYTSENTFEFIKNMSDSEYYLTKFK